MCVVEGHHSEKSLTGWQAARLVEHGYVRRYMRSMQIADMVNSMHDLMQMSQHELSPMLALRQFHMAVANGQHPSPASLQSMPRVTELQVKMFTYQVPSLAVYSSRMPRLYPSLIVSCKQIQ